MSVLASSDFDDHEEVVFVNDREAGLRAIIAIHSTALGPALGGCRMYPHANEADAIKDVLRLSRGMTYKAAVAGVKLGGGKSVILGDSRQQKTEHLLRAVGRAVERLQGRDVLGEDIGTNPDDMRVMRSETRAVSCLRAEDGGYGDPAPMTALGTFHAIRAGLRYRRGSDNLQDVKAAIQGVGNVGRNLCCLLVDVGARVAVCDTYEPNAKSVATEFGTMVVDPDAIYALDLCRPHDQVRGVKNHGESRGSEFYVSEDRCARLRAFCRLEARRTRGRAFQATPESIHQRQPSHVPCARLGSPREFGESCAFLCSLQAGHITGQKCPHRWWSVRPKLLTGIRVAHSRTNPRTAETKASGSSQCIP